MRCCCSQGHERRGREQFLQQSQPQLEHPYGRGVRHRDARVAEWRGHARNDHGRQHECSHCNCCCCHLSALWLGQRLQCRGTTRSDKQRHTCLIMCKIVALRLSIYLSLFLYLLVIFLFFSLDFRNIYYTATITCSSIHLFFLDVDRIACFICIFLI